MVQCSSKEEQAAPSFLSKVSNRNSTGVRTLSEFRTTSECKRSSEFKVVALWGGFVLSYTHSPEFLLE